MNAVVINVILWLSIVVGWVIYNLYVKNKKLENIVIKQNSFVYEMIGLMKELDSAVEKIDAKVWTSADSELSGLFDSVKGIQSRIKTYLDS
jgi:hypothetical protein